MINIREHINLKELHTFGIDVYASFYTEINDTKDLRELIKLPVFIHHKKLILGGGSNILFTDDFNGIVIKNNIKGIRVEELPGDELLVSVGAGEVWHDFVMYCISHQYCGLENLSLIPGCVGASPMQNIGAYGVEIKDVFYNLKAISLADGTERVFNKEECEFGYRESIFKRRLKDQYIITEVTFRLSKTPKPNTSYGAIAEELKKSGINAPTIRDVSNAVIAIRSSKLPNPKEIGNAGSFFKNPEVAEDKFETLKQKFPDMVSYPLDNGNFKLAAGWLIEKTGLKGYTENGAGVHDKQALVLVNKGVESGKQIYQLSELVIKKVKEMFGVELEREVNIA